MPVHTEFAGQEHDHSPHPVDRINDERHDENRLKPEYVRSVRVAVEAKIKMQFTI